MIVIFFKFPNNSHPLHDTPYMKRVSTDGFGICIEAVDPQFDEQKVRAFFASVGGTDIAAVHYDLEDRRHGAKMFDLKFITLLVTVAGLVAVSTYVMLNIVLYAPPLTG